MKIFIIDLESVESRYTCQWKNGIPKLLERESKKRNIVPIHKDPDLLLNSFEKKKTDKKDNSIYIIPIEGEQISQSTTSGAFLDFSATNVYKSSQIIKFSKLVQNGFVENNDKILVTDAWNPGVIQIRYMLDLLNIKAEIHSIWHAGSYDNFDFLGRLIENKNWSKNFERSLFHASDYNYVATKFHTNLLKRNLFKINEKRNMKKLVVSGQPHNEIIENVEKYLDNNKEKKIIFPHRIAEEKQPEIFRDLAKEMPEYKFIIAQEMNFTKDEYYRELASSKIMFSANLQETLGISAMESVLVNTFPLLPNRLSYKEIYFKKFLYNSKFTKDKISYYKNKEKLKNIIKQIMEKPDLEDQIMEKQKQILKDYYLYPGPMLENLFQIKKGE